MQTRNRSGDERNRIEEILLERVHCFSLENLSQYKLMVQFLVNFCLLSARENDEQRILEIETVYDLFFDLAHSLVEFF